MSFKHYSTGDRLRAEETENEKLKAENEKLRADLEYLAIMADIEIDDEEDEKEAADHE